MRLCKFGIHSWKEHMPSVERDDSTKILCGSIITIVGTPYPIVLVGRLVDAEAGGITCSVILLTILLIVLLLILLFAVGVLSGVHDGYPISVYNKTCLNCYQSNFAATELAEKLNIKNEKAKKEAKKEERLKLENEHAALEAYAKNLKRYEQAKEKLNETV